MTTSNSVANLLDPGEPRVGYQVSSHVAFITMDSPPVNGLNLAIRSGLIEALKRADKDPYVRAVVLTGYGRGFSAGGDIKEFGTPAATAAPALSLHVHPVIEAMTKPVIAAIHGIAIGGGLETALACHYRVAETTAKIGLPEVGLGTFPLSGTQRLPRLLGLQASLELILSGRITFAQEFPELFDALVEPGRALSAATALAETVSAEAPHLPLVRHLPVPPDHAQHPSLCAPGTSPTQAQRYAMVAIGMAIDAESFDSGLARARVLFNELMDSDRVVAAREQFFAGRSGEPSSAQ